jgi:uncharacterized MAPEG superfamily protein
MTIADVCLFLAMVLIIASIAPAKADGKGEFDNANPRDPGFYRPGLRARALGAHQNGYETFPFFAVAVVLAEMRAVPQAITDGLAAAFLLLRIAFVLLYLGNRASARSIVWSLGFACNVALFFAPLWAR